MFLTLDEYLTGAQKLIHLYGYTCHRTDEDAISSVASAMMKADQTWDGRSSRNTWRFNQAVFEIMKLKTKHRKRKKIVSLDKVVSMDGARKEVYLRDIIADKSDNNVIESFREVMEWAKNNLSQRQFDCLRLYYCEDLTLEVIGSQLGITKQAVSLSIKKGIDIIKDECKSQIDYTTS
jgi:RNA polymerase sigma factor (sigma-70 family)